jgi:BCD family chlorophyll transporter-like MFS transporter
MTRGAKMWRKLSTDFLPFADAATTELPLPRLLRLSLFQVSIGLSFVLLNFTLNRILIVELHVSATLVAAMVALPLLFAPARALIGHKSDNHASILGWKRVPYIWFGTLMQFGGLAIMPFALLLMTGGGRVGGPEVGVAGACLAFLFIGAGMATAQTAGLALATDLAPEEKRPRVVALLYVMLLVGMFIASLIFGQILDGFDPNRLVGVIQGTAVVTALLNIIALWKQEARLPGGIKPAPDAMDFAACWHEFVSTARTRRLLVALALGAAGFSMQDILLEPYGGHVLGLNVGQTTLLSALWSGGMIAGFAWAARTLDNGGEPHRMASFGVLIGIGAFAVVVLSAPLHSAPMLAIGAAGIGLGGGLFAVGTLIAAMALATDGKSGLALGAWGAVQATAAGVAILVSGALRDGFGALAMSGRLGAGFVDAASGYSFVWHIEIALLFVTLVALGPLARRSPDVPHRARFGLNEFPS